MTTHNATRNTFAARIGLILLLLALGAVPQTALAGEVTDANAFEKSATAATTADHEALAVYFGKKAEEAGKTVRLHEKMLAASLGGRNYTSMLQHCQALIRSNREAQESYTNLANLHARLAKEAGQ